MNPIRITFKTPDAVEYALDDQPDFDLEDPDLDEEAREARETAYDEAKVKLAKWVKYGELVTIEFDLDKGTATVLEAR